MLTLTHMGTNAGFRFQETRKTGRRNEDPVCTLTLRVTRENEQRENTEIALVWASRLHIGLHTELESAAGEIKSLTLAAEVCVLTPIESKEALVTQDFLKTVKAVFVHQLPDNRARAPLVLHPGLHQIDGIHRCGPHSYEQNSFKAFK